MEMELIYIIILLLTGIGVGFAGGLLGIGGCFIMVPVQCWVLTAMNVGPGMAILIAFGTNLAVVLPTAVSGTYGHNKKGVVVWSVAIGLGLSGLAGAVIGGCIATYIASIGYGKSLQILFGLIIIASAVRMLTAKPIKTEQEIVDAPAILIAWGLPLGILCGIIGIGGGVVLIPVMVLALHLKMHQAVGTSTAMMVFTATGGVISYIINGLGVAGLPPYSLGYVNILQWALLAGTSVPMALVGVKAAHKLPARELKYVFIVVMIYMGLKMAGVFSWLNLPL